MIEYIVEAISCKSDDFMILPKPKNFGLVWFGSVWFDLETEPNREVSVWFTVETKPKTEPKTRPNRKPNRINQTMRSSNHPYIIYL